MKKRIICTLLSAVLACMALASCGGNENDTEKTTEVKATAVTSENTSTATEESTSAVMRKTTQIQQSYEMITGTFKANTVTAAKKNNASGNKTTAKKNTSSATKKKTTTTQKKNKVAAPTPTTSKYEVSPSAINHYIGTVKKAWIINDMPGIKVQIGRVELNKNVTQHFDKNINTQIVNPKTITYKPTCSVAVITCDNPERLKGSKGTSLTQTETIAKNVGANIALDGVATYETASEAVVRNGDLYKQYTGTPGGARQQLVMYRDGTWKFVDNFDNETARNEIAKGAYNSISFQHIAVQNGQIVAKRGSNEVYRNRAYIGRISSNKYVFMTTEFMPVYDAAEVLKAYGVQDAVQTNGGNCALLYVKGIGNTTGATGGKIAPLNKVGYLETEWFAKNGMLASKRGGGPCDHELDIFYF